MENWFVTSLSFFKRYAGQEWWLEPINKNQLVFKPVAATPVYFLSSLFFVVVSESRASSWYSRVDCAGSFLNERTSSVVEFIKLTYNVSNRVTSLKQIIFFL